MESQLRALLWIGLSEDNHRTHNFITVAHGRADVFGGETAAVLAPEDVVLDVPLLADCIALEAADGGLRAVRTAPKGVRL